MTSVLRGHFYDTRYKTFRLLGLIVHTDQYKVTSLENRKWKTVTMVKQIQDLTSQFSFNINILKQV